jgi:hypothetical protein
MKTADKLTKFRKDCEKQAGSSASDIDTPLAHVLDDVCRVLGLKARDRKRVLGKRSTIRLETTRDMQVEIIKRK